MNPADVLWTPPSDALERSRIGDFMRWVGRTRGHTFETYEEVWH
jgi:acetoacetyl-CoA synthetase